jgi:hypothetical protein
MEWATVQQGPPWAVDSWGLGCMMQVRGCCQVEMTGALAQTMSVCEVGGQLIRVFVWLDGLLCSVARNAAVGLL